MLAESGERYAKQFENRRDPDRIWHWAVCVGAPGYLEGDRYFLEAVRPLCTALGAGRRLACVPAFAQEPCQHLRVSRRTG